MARLTVSAVFAVFAALTVSATLAVLTVRTVSAARSSRHRPSTARRRTTLLALVAPRVTAWALPLLLIPVLVPVPGSGRANAVAAPVPAAVATMAARGPANALPAPMPSTTHAAAPGRAAGPGDLPSAAAEPAGGGALHSGGAPRQGRPTPTSTDDPAPTTEPAPAGEPEEPAEPNDDEPVETVEPREVPGGRAWPVGPRDDPPPRVVRSREPPPTPYAAGHRGVDLAATPGDTVRAAANGTVFFTGRIAGRPVLSIALDRSGSPPLRITYEPVDTDVARGDRVTAGEPVGRLGAGPFHCQEGCLHWGLLRGDAYLDPLSLMTGHRGARPPSRLLPVFDVPEPPDPHPTALSGAPPRLREWLLVALLTAGGCWAQRRMRRPRPVRPWRRAARRGRGRTDGAAHTPGTRAHAPDGRRERRGRLSRTRRAGPCPRRPP